MSCVNTIGDYGTGGEKGGDGQGRGGDVLKIPIAALNNEPTIRLHGVPGNRIG